MQDKNIYVSPFSTRYAGKEMQYVFSENFKFTTWRRLWVSLAKAEQKLGLNITDEQIAEMEAHVSDINYDVAVAREKECRRAVNAPPLRHELFQKNMKKCQRLCKYSPCLVRRE